MVREIRARFHGGRIELLEEVSLREGEEVIVTVKEEGDPLVSKEAFVKAAGAWKGSLDFEAYLRDLYASRRDPGRHVNL
ncbi:MAG: antitoxin family protein [Chloroflexi bacterium]|nr:antitoxin family protein [Chloroflexota bacterium]